MPLLIHLVQLQLFLNTFSGEQGHINILRIVNRATSYKSNNSTRRKPVFPNKQFLSTSNINRPKFKLKRSFIPALSGAKVALGKLYMLRSA